MKSGLESEHIAKDSLKRILSDIPDSTAWFRADEGGVDFFVTLNTKMGDECLAVDVKARARPDEIVWSADQFALLNRVHGRCFVPVLMAPYVSTQAADKCKEVGINWADFVGNCEIQLANAFIKVRGIANPYADKRGTASLFTPVAARVVHALLLDPKKRWKVDELAERAEASTGQVSNVRRLLSQQDWIDAGYGGITLKCPEKLLQDWRKHYTPKRDERKFFTLESFEELTARLEENLAHYALTEFASAEHFAPHTRYQRFAFYTSDEWDTELADELHLRPGDPANVTVYLGAEGLQFQEKFEFARCTSPILTYLDLSLLKGRGQDAADFLLETVIKARWK